FPAAEWVVPRVMLVRRGGRTHLVATAIDTGGARELSGVLARARAALLRPFVTLPPSVTLPALGAPPAPWRPAAPATLRPSAAARPRRHSTTLPTGVSPSWSLRVRAASARRERLTRSASSPDCVARTRVARSSALHRAPRCSSARRPSAWPGSPDGGSTPPRSPAPRRAG